MGLFSELIAETLARLDRQARWVLLALSVVGEPIAVSGVDFLLRPFAPGLDVPSLVRPPVPHSDRVE